jgi:3-dehydroquinate synthase
MAEVVKYGVLGDAQLFNWLEQHTDAIQRRDPDVLAEMISRCCRNKAAIVAADEKESGVRALLNLGHTFGHAIEAHMGYGQWLHGEAVATGMVIASTLAESMNLLESSESRRIIDLLSAFDLPVKAPQNMGFEDFIVHMRRDKKNIGGKLRLIIPTAIGKTIIRDDIDEELLKQVL